MRRRFIFDMSKNKNNNNIIKYTTTDGNILIPYVIDFGVVLLSNTYIGAGTILFKDEIKYIGDDVFNTCTNLTSIEIPNSVRSIGNNAFDGCTSLTSVIIGNSVSSIGRYAFYLCGSLTSIEIPNSVTSIEYMAFYGCTSLTSVEIGNNIENIGNDAFRGCRSLTSVYIKATTPPTLGSSVFNRNASNRKIYVPRASLNAYKTANGWSEYADVIEPYDFDGSVNEITFYIDDGMYVTPMKALSNMTYGEFVNSEYANQNSMLTDFRLKGYGAYNGILFYHEEAMFDMTLYVDNSVHDNVHDYDVIEDGKTYYAY